MNDQTQGTLPRSEKGPIAPAPILKGTLGAIVAAVASWPGISATAHWSLFDKTVVDGAYFYLGEEELGHLHLDGSIHLASSPALGKALVAEGKAKPFRYQAGWVEQHLQRIGVEAAISLFRRNYERLRLKVGTSN
jgi:hypothetical protein